MEINENDVVEQHKMSNKEERFEVDRSILCDVYNVNCHIFLVSSLFILVIYLIFRVLQDPEAKVRKLTYFMVKNLGIIS